VLVALLPLFSLFTTVCPMPDSYSALLIPLSTFRSSFMNNPGQALETRPQCEVLAFDLLYRQLPHRMLRGREMPLIDARFVRVITSDTKGASKARSFRNTASFRVPTT
jgi:hypothetical protein